MGFRESPSLSHEPIDRTVERVALPAYKNFVISGDRRSAFDRTTGSMMVPIQKKVGIQQKFLSGW